MSTPRQVKAAKKLSENIGKAKPESLGKVLKEAGYAESTSESPKLVTEGKGFQGLMEKYLPDDDVLRAHQQLLKTTRVEHMVFPLGPKTNDEPTPEPVKYEMEAQAHGGELLRRHADGESVPLSDADIVQLLGEVNCRVRKIVHGETARHVYFWSPDAGAQKAAIELAYKIKGRITNKFEGKLNGDLTVALVEFVDDDQPSKD